MRVIAGTAKGHKLQSVKGMATRPTTDRIKETLFNILSADCVDADFLDLFGGTGAIGIEALSRGARLSVFVDSSPHACTIIEKNLKFTNLYDKAKIIQSDIIAGIRSLRLQGYGFDIIFMDPPYIKTALITDTLQVISENGILNETGYIIAEMPSRDELPVVDSFSVFKIKDFKTTKMVFFKLNMH